MDGTLVKEGRSQSPVQSSQFTIGKLDAGIAVLLGDESSHLIEFPSLLLPPGCQPGSIVSISCTRNQHAEKARSDEFWQLQSDILAEFGERTPATPVLKLRNVTQTSVTLEWDRLDLATARLLGLNIWRNGQRVASIPNPQTNTSTKLSGLELDHEYAFHLVLKTSAGTFSSNQLKVRTHKITDTSGICVCFGAISPPTALDHAKEALEAMGAKYSEKIQIDTTHFVCTSPGTGAPAIQYQRALQLSIPTVLPSWVLACQREKRMVQIAAHYLGSANPPPQTHATSAPVRAEPAVTPAAAAESPQSPEQAAPEPGSPSDTATATATTNGTETHSTSDIPPRADPDASDEVAEALPEINEANIDTVESSADFEAPRAESQRSEDAAHHVENAPAAAGTVDLDALEEVALDESYRAE